MSDLLSDLDAATTLGMKLCGQAAETIRRMVREAEEAEKRHAESRADALVAALAEQPITATRIATSTLRTWPNA